MYEDMIAALMQDMQVDMPSARASALRGQQFSQSPMVPPPPDLQPPPMLPQPGMGPGGPPGGPPGPPMPPQATQPPPMPAGPSQRPPGGPPGPMLPQALAAQRPPPAPSPSIDPYQQQAKLLQGQHDTAMAGLEQSMQPPDTGPMQEAYRKRAQESPKYLLNAMAAQYAGKPDFAKYHLGQAAAVDQPLKTATGTMTPQGFIEDPSYGQAMKVRSAEARVAAIEKAQAQNITAREHARLEKEKQEAIADRQREMAAYQRGTAVMVKGMTAGGGEGGFGGADTQVGTDPATKNPVYRHTKSGQLFSYGNDGRPVPYRGTFAPKTTSSAGNVTEGERKAATLLKRLEFSEAQLSKAVGEAPGAATPGYLESAAGHIPLVGENLANVARSPERQRVETAQLDLLDAALTLGTGAAYTNEQLKGYARSYFPQIGDDDTTVADKAARLKNILAAARIAAGRAGSQVEPPADVAPPAGPPGSGALSPQESEELLLLRQKFKTRQ